MNKDAKIYIAGHKGLVGSAIVKNLKFKGYNNLIVKTRAELDLKNQKLVDDFFQIERPEYVIIAAAKVGGIVANNIYRADFIYDNIMIQSNIIHSSYMHNVKKLMFLGSTCIYPRNAPQPIKEDALLTSTLEYTNEPYAIAKISGIKMCESYNMQYGTNFISVMPTNLYGPNDNFDLEKSHVLPALIRKIYLGRCLELGDWDAIRLDFQKNPVKDFNINFSKEKIEKTLFNYGITKKNIEIWGSGRPMREFLWSEDMADACVFILEKVSFKDTYDLNSTIIQNTHINIGTGKDISIKDLSYLIKSIIGYEGSFFFDKTKPDGTMKKLTDVSKLHSMGWKHSVNLEEGVNKLYNWYLKK